MGSVVTGHHASSLMQMNDEQPLRLSFGPVAEAFDRGRPAYSAQTASWLIGSDPLDVLELGAGTGKLTAELVAQGHRVLATDPDEGMLDVLARNVPGARTAQVSAEKLPFGDRSFDVVVVAQAFHWFDSAHALPEIARVLRTGGHLALVWHERDTRIPWVRRFGAVIGDDDRRGSTDLEVESLIASRHFGVVLDATFKNWQRIDREIVVDLALSRAAIASLPAELRAEKLAETLVFYDDFGRGMDGMELPYVVRCFRTQVIERAQPTSQVADAEPQAGVEPDQENGLTVHSDAGAPATEAAQAETLEARRRRSQEIFTSDGTDTDMLLIDFR